MATIYLVQQGSTLRKEQGRFLVKSREGEKAPPLLEIPIREVEQVLVFGNIQLTTSAISACLDAGISVLFLTQAGAYKGHLWSVEQGNLTAEFAQFKRFTEANFQLEIARSLVLGKLNNSRQLLLRLHRKRSSELLTTAIAGIAQDMQQAAKTDHLDALRGYEGSAAARYFPAFGQLLLNQDWNFAQRNRRPPTDPVNAMLSYGYTLLFNNVLSLLLAEGLNPYLGNLHRSDRREPHLAFDLMEEFRSPIIDTLVLVLTNKSVIKPDEFTQAANGGVYLTDAARRRFLSYFEQRIGTQITHPDVQDPVTYRRAIQLQIRRYKRSLIESVPYRPFLRAV